MRLPVARAPQRYGTVILKRGQHASFALTCLHWGLKMLRAKRRAARSR
jgi:hypothetical protein